MLALRPPPQNLPARSAPVVRAEARAVAEVAEDAVKAVEKVVVVEGRVVEEVEEEEDRV